MPYTFPGVLALYGTRELRIATVLFCAYLAITFLTVHYLPPLTYLTPGLALALGAFYFGGMRMWPWVLASSLLAPLIAQGEVGIREAVVVSVTGALGAYLLIRYRIDPLFRRRRDIFIFLAVGLSISIIPALFVPHTPLPSEVWRAYVAAASVVLVITPFILRWFSKRRFSRNIHEMAEIGAVFALLAGINALYFVSESKRIFDIPVIYFLLLPLFWIALRLRPRFMTTALLFTALVGVIEVVAHTGEAAILERLFSLEALLIAATASFSIITTLEEDRRVTTNALRSQMETLSNAVARIGSESQAKNEFIATLAHELRNPLAPIASSIELLKTRCARDSEEELLISVMEDRMHTVRRLLEDLLDISRISEGKVRIEKTEVDIVTVLERAILSTEHHRNELHQRLLYKAPTARLAVVGDAVRLEQVFSNLLTNASKYSSSGDTISVGVKTVGRLVEIEVQDEGVGLSPEHIEKIFLPFAQIEHGARTTKGLGIGLSLARTFVELHDGIIEVQSDGPRTGSRFIVRLPLHASEEKTVHSPTPHAPRLSTAPHVLIVDDNDAASAILGKLLELEGCTISYAYDGEQAHEAALQQAPAAILLDIGLPGENGYTVARKLRADGYQGRIIALSGYNADSAGESWQQAGFDYYLVKPATLADLRTALAFS